MVPIRTKFLVFGGVHHSLEVDSCSVAGSSGDAAHEPTGVLPSSSSFFSAFNILLHWVSSLLMASPLLRPISLDVEMYLLAATSRIMLGLYFFPRHFFLFFSNPCQLIQPIARTLLNSSSLPSSFKRSSAHWCTLVDGQGGHL